MNTYSLLPLISLFANLIGFFYIIYINPKSKLNQFFGFFTASVALWSFATFYNFNAVSSSELVFWEKIGTIGAVLTGISVFHFILIYAKHKLSANKIFLFLLYLSGLFLIVIEYTTNLFTIDAKPVDWGFAKTSGEFDVFLSVYVALLVILSLFILHKLRLKTSSDETKKQINFLNVALVIPLIGGIITQVIPQAINIELIPLTSSLTTITAVIILFSIFRYGFIRPMSLSIQKKFVSIFFLAIFILSFTFLVTTNIVANQEIGVLYRDELSSIAKSRADTIEGYLEEHKVSVLQFASNKALIDFLNADKLNTNYSDFYEDANYTINSFYEIDAHIDQIHIVNKSKLCVLSTKGQSEIGKPKAKDLDFSDENISIYVKDIFLCPETNKPAITITVPINDLGAVIVKYNAEEIYNILADTTGLRDTGEVYLVNNTGFMISPSRLYNTTYNYENILFKQKVDTENFHNCMLHAIYSDEELKSQHEEVKITYDYRGEKVLATHIYIPERQWALLAEIDANEAYASVSSMQNILTYIIAFFSIIALIVAFFYSKTISNPIKKLDNYAKEIQKGNLNAKSDIQTNDEIGSLSKSFNKMADSLKNYTENLEKQIDERTKELKDKIQELERFKKVTVGRELRMAELKKELRDLQEKDKLGGNNFDA